MGWYWKQTEWNEYTLIGPKGERETFKTFDAMSYWCLEHGIYATQV